MKTKIIIAIFTIQKVLGQIVAVDAVGEVHIKPVVQHEPLGTIANDQYARLTFYERANINLPNSLTARASFRMDQLRNLNLFSHQSNLNMVTFQIGTGNVGIGNSNPLTALDINGITQTSGLKIPTNAGLNKVLTSDATGNGTWQTLSIPAPSQWNSVGSNIHYSAGYVGVGTANPGAALHVQTASDNPVIIDGGSNMYITLAENAANMGYIGSKTGNSEDVDFGTHPDNTKGSVHIITDATQQVSITPDGDVGIGTTIPAAKLDVTGSIKASEIRLVNGAGADKILTSDASGNAKWSKITKQDVLMINGADFDFVEDRGIFEIYKDNLNGGITNLHPNNAAFTLIAPVHLPHGARVTALTAYYKDNSPAAYFDFKLRSENMTGPSTIDLATFSQATSFASTSFQSQPFGIFSPIVINNNDFGYFIQVHSNDWVGRNLNEEDTTLKGVKIQFEYDLN